MFISIPAWRNKHYISMEKLLLLIGHFYADAKWYVKFHEIAPTPKADALESIDPSQAMTLASLIHRVTPEVQVIDGEIKAIYDACPDRYLLLRAVDSTSWDIETDSSDVIKMVCSQFPDAQFIAE